LKFQIDIRTIKCIIFYDKNRKNTIQGSCKYRRL